MAMNFPSSPTDGQEFVVNKVIYTWSSATGTWQAGKTGTARPFNFIVNPAMLISQQNGNTAGVTGTGAGPYGYYIADNWISAGPIATDGAISVARVAVTTPKDGPYRFRYTVTTADTALITSQGGCFQQRFEGQRIAPFCWGTSSSITKQLVLRFGWKSPAGTYSVAIRNHVPDKTYLTKFTITAGQANTDTEQILVIPGQPDFNVPWEYDKSYAMQLSWTIGMGPDSTSATAGWQDGSYLALTGQTNGFATVNNTFELFDVGLYLDPDLTGLPPPWESPPESQAMLDGQRYWCKSPALRGISQPATQLSRAGLTYPVVMAANPTITEVGAINAYDVAITSAITALPQTYPNPFYCEINGTTTGLTAGRAGLMVGTLAANHLASSARI